MFRMFIIFGYQFIKTNSDEAATTASP